MDNDNDGFKYVRDSREKEQTFVPTPTPTISSPTTRVWLVLRQTAVVTYIKVI